MQIHELKPKTKRTKARVIGRGGKRGKTSGKGHKGQKARTGRKIRLELRDQIKKIPKLRGRGTHPNKAVSAQVASVNISTLSASFTEGMTVTPEKLYEKKIIRKISGKMPVVKILGGGELTKKVNVTGCVVSGVAKEKIEKLGGVIS